ncbi:MAG: hypothetical protein A2498_13535 [Lentisphaerae bacterium RIFOXYC12_FULL_60_16]|nr:MAG: hypothetical protein A2498_13535 [Lentisphaerae bacterium RIFOXYC12_FULL_60_16]OGV71541.1 MAG: hypothetical protein A2269_04630 [Lentisphaerae bacterium RIFOXYA12_FULL_60_10]OGV83790.1 MAG: hypothetical protein A2340_05480 [Lentisphaerae bacterium RIFOXYB12_FULL_60_10]
MLDTWPDTTFHACMKALISHLPLLLAIAGALSGCRTPRLTIPAGPVRSLESAQADLITIEKHFPPIPKTTVARTHWENGRTLLRQARFLATAYTPTPTMLERLSRTLDQTSFHLTMVTGRPPRGILTGRIDSGFLDDLDNSFQPFVVYLPTAIRHRQPLPLLVFLHGYSPRFNLVNWSYIPDALQAFAEQHGWAIAAPFGRGNTDYQGIGERDVLRVVSEMQTRYSIDPDRIVLSGLSMGGMGVWTLAAHHPDRFAGALIIAGRGDYYFWKGIERNTLPVYRQRLIDTEFASGLLPNLANLPLFCAHAADDEVVPTAETRHMVELVKTVNPTIQYLEFPTGNHWICEEVFSHSEVQSWLMALRRQTPPSVHYRAWHPRYPAQGLYGIRAWTGDPAHEPFTLHIQPGREGLSIRSRHITRIQICRNLLPPAWRSLPIHNPDPVPLEIADQPESLQHPPPTGPIGQAFLKPFLFVCKADTTTPDIITAFQERCREWQRYAHAAPRIRFENRFDTADLARYNVLVFNEPEAGDLAATLAALLPIRITPESYQAGSITIPRAGNGLFAVIRSPWNPERLAALQCGPAWGPDLPDNHRYDTLPDYVIYSGPSPQRILLAGTFTPTGAIDPATQYHAPEQVQNSH